MCDIRSGDESYGVRTLEAEDRYVRDSYGSSLIFKNYLRQHQALIMFVERMEAVFTLTILGQVVLFSGLICLVGYQAFLVSIELWVWARIKKFYDLQD